MLTIGGLYTYKLTNTQSSLHKYTQKMEFLIGFGKKFLTLTSIILHYRDVVVHIHVMNVVF